MNQQEEEKAIINNNGRADLKPRAVKAMHVVNISYPKKEKITHDESEPPESGALKVEQTAS